jgi:hypothetical protein
MGSMEIVDEVLSKEGYVSSEEFAREGALVLALSRLEQYRAEKEHYEKKYGMAFSAFESEVHSHKGTENFEKEEDIEDWGFALKALEWWEQKTKDLQDA